MHCTHNAGNKKYQVEGTMDQIKKKLAALKQEKEDAIDKAEDAERGKKEAEARADAVSNVKLKAHWF